MALFYWQGGGRDGQWRRAYPDAGQEIATAARLLRAGYVARIAAEAPEGPPGADPVAEALRLAYVLDGAAAVALGCPAFGAGRSMAAGEIAERLGHRYTLDEIREALAALAALGCVEPRDGGAVCVALGAFRPEAR
jgi:hypothetical protein